MPPLGIGRPIPSKGAASGSSTWDSARQLLGKLRTAKLFTAFQAWKALSEFEATVKASEQAIGTHEAVLRKAPSQRSPKEVQALVQLLQQIKAYKALPQPVLAFLATYARVLFVWDACELPASGQEQGALFSIISGGMTCVVGEPSDPVLRCIVRQAADQLLEVHDTLQPAAASPKPVGDPRASSPLTATDAVQSGTSPVPATPSSLPASFEVLKPYLGPHLPHLERFAVPECCNKVWHTVTSMIHGGHMPSRAQAETLLRRLGVLTGGREGRPSTYGGARSSYAGGPARMSHAGGVQFSLTAAPRASYAGMQLEKGGPRPSHNGAAATAQAQASSYAGVTLLELCVGDSFSGKDLDCRAESGQSESSTAEFPPRTLAAVPRANCLTALVVISKAVYRHAMQLVREVMVQQAVQQCCRLPFLRHTPLRELFRLSHHLTLTTYKEGETLLYQDKEAPHIFFLLEGSVDVIMEVPLQPDMQTLAAWNKLGSPIQPSSRLQSPDIPAHRDHQLSPVVPGSTSGSTTEPSTRSRAGSVAGRKGEVVPEGPKQRVLLATKTAPACLGDEGLRGDKLMPVSVVVSSPQAVCLWTTQQRFAVSLDGLTLRLFQKLLPQLTLPPLLQKKLVSPADAHGVDWCRASIIHDTWHPSKVPLALKRPGAGQLAQSEVTPAPWNFPGMPGFFGTIPSLYSTELQGRLSADSGSVTHQDTCPSPVSLTKTGQSTTPPLPTGISSSWLKGITVTESIEMLQRMVVSVEQSRAGSLPSSPMRKKVLAAPQLPGSCVPTMSSSSLSPVRCMAQPEVLDMRGCVVQAANQRKASEVMSAACIGYISISVLPGQMGGTLDEVAPVLDDVNNAWSQLAHQCRCSLLRWSNHEYYVYGETSSSTCTVRLLSDLMLGMLAAFDQHVAEGTAHHHVLHAGLAAGSLYVSADNGLVTTIGGPGVDACMTLCEAAKEEWPADSSIMVTDAVMQAISRTHITAFAGQGYRLVLSRQLPFNTSLETLMGQESPSIMPTASVQAAGDGKQGFLAGFRHSKQKLWEGPKQYNQNPEMAHVAHFAGSSQVVALQDGLLMQTGVAAQPPAVTAGSTQPAKQQPCIATAAGQRQTLPRATAGLRHGKPGRLLPVRHPNLAKGVSPRKVTDQVDGREYASSTEQPKHQMRVHQAQRAAEWQGRWGSAPVLSSRMSDMREAAGCKSVVEVRDQLRAELRQLGRDCPASGDFSHIPHSSFKSGSPGAGDARSPRSNHIDMKCISPQAKCVDDASFFLTQSQCDLAPVLQDHNRSYQTTGGSFTAGLLPPAASDLPSHSYSHLMRPSPFLVTTFAPQPPAGCSQPVFSQQSSSPHSYNPNVTLDATAPMHGQQWVGGHGGDDSGLDQQGGTRTQQLASLGWGSDCPSNNNSPQRSSNAPKAQGERSTVRAAHAFVHGLHPGQVQVSFSTAGLPKLPPISMLAQLDSLAISFNQLRRLSSSWLAALGGQLHILCCTHSEVRQLPDDLGNILPSLTELNLAQNEITQLPDSLSLMVKLRCLSVEHNQVSHLPAGICSLDALQQLHLGHNQLTQLPDDWAHLPALSLLHVHNNQLQALPSSITCLVNLTSLDASCNELTTLPARCLQTLSNLRSLRLAYNKLCTCQQIHGARADRSQFNDERAYQREHTPLRACPSNAALQHAHARTTSFARHSLASAPSFMHSLRRTEQFQQLLHSFRSQCSLHSQHSLHSQYSRNSQFSQRPGSMLGWSPYRTDPGIAGFEVALGSSKRSTVETGDGCAFKLGFKRSSTCPGLGQSNSKPGTSDSRHRQAEGGKGLVACVCASSTGAADTSPADNTEAATYLQQQQQPALQSAAAGAGSTIVIKTDIINTGAIHDVQCGSPLPAALTPVGHVEQPLYHSSSIQESKQGVAGVGPALKGGILQTASRGVTPGSVDRPRSQHARLRVVLPQEQDKPLSADPGLHNQLPPALQPVLGKVLDGLQAAQGLAAQVETSSEDGLVEQDDEEEQQQPSTGVASPTTPNGGQQPSEAAVLLPCLQLLDLQGNQLVGVPAWLPPSLTHLNLSRNSITKVAAWLPERLHNLKLLELHANQLRDLPVQLKPLLAQLHLLTLQDNPATSPEALEAVNSETSDGTAVSGDNNRHLGPKVENVSWAWELMRAARYNNRKAKSLGTGPHTTCNTPVSEDRLDGTSNSSFVGSSRPASSKTVTSSALRRSGNGDSCAGLSPLKAVPSQGISVAASSVSLAAGMT